MLKRSIFCIFLMIIASAGAFGQEKITIAVLDLQPKGTSKIVAGVVTDIIRSEMIKTGLYVVIERSQMDEIMKEQSFQLTGCVEQSCAVQIGKILSASKVLVGELGAVGSAFMITVRIVDVEKGSSEFAANERSENEDGLDAAAVSLTKKLSQSIVDQNPDYFVARRKPMGYYFRGFVPGWSQIYAGSDTKGYILAGAFVAAAGFMGYSLYDWSAKKKDYEDLGDGTPQSKMDSKYNTAEKAATVANVAIYMAAGVYLLNWIDVLFFTDYNPPEENKKAELEKPFFYNFAVVPDYSKNISGTISFGMRF